MLVLGEHLLLGIRFLPFREFLRPLREAAPTLGLQTLQSVPLAIDDNTHVVQFLVERLLVDNFPRNVVDEVSEAENGVQGLEEHQIDHLDWGHLGGELHCILCQIL